jgi:perosamine synthetase
MVPVFEPVIGDVEIEAVVAALKRGEISGSFGIAIAQFEERFAEYCGCKYGAAVNSGTSALHLAVHAAEFRPGDEMLVSASTNVASALSAYHNGVVPVPVDSEEITWNLNLDLIESLITPRTRAIMPVHLYGHPVDMDRLCAIAERHRLVIIEDCAEAHGATCRGKRVGGLGHLGCFSFYANKVITTGEGGMVTTNDEKLAKRLRLLRNLAFTNPRFRHEEAGYNFRMAGYQAAMGLAQLDKIEHTIAAKRRVAEMYSEALEDVPGLQLPTEADWAKSVYWMYALVVRPEFGITRDDLVEHLRREGIETRTFFCPMNQQPFLKRQVGYREVSCPVADGLWQTGLYLPSSPTLNERTILQISQAIMRAHEASVLRGN